jgi:hypothetical protein
LTIITNYHGVLLGFLEQKGHMGRPEISKNINKHCVTFAKSGSFPVNKMGSLYRLDVAESECGNPIAPSPTIIDTEAFKSKLHLQ